MLFPMVEAMEDSRTMTDEGGEAPCYAHLVETHEIDH